VPRGHPIWLLGLLAWVGPTSAQEVKIHPLSVSIHTALVHPALTQQDIEEILKRASDLLQEAPNNCKVGFKLNGPIGRFTVPSSTNDGSINTEDDLEAVHSVVADVKIVPKINFCVQGLQHGLVGCAWRPHDRPKTVIVTAEMHRFRLEHIVLAHEFGHVTGLLHRQDVHEQTLMTPCGLNSDKFQVNPDECWHFRAGPAMHYPQGVGDACPTTPSAHPPG